MTDKQESSGVKGASANITDQERDWAQQALAEYEQKKYKLCLQHLNRLEEVRPRDSKVQLNKAIVEYYDNSLCTTDKFQKSFADVCKQVMYLLTYSFYLSAHYYYYWSSTGRPKP